MTTGTIHFSFSATGAPERVQTGENRADGVDPWAAVETDRAWRAEQAELLQLAEAADAEAVLQDE